GCLSAISAKTRRRPCNGRDRPRRADLSDLTRREFGDINIAAGVDGNASQVGKHPRSGSRPVGYLRCPVATRHQRDDTRRTYLTDTAVSVEVDIDVPGRRIKGRVDRKAKA